jgi:hypothetical protein
MSDPVPLRLVSDFHEPYDHHFASRHREDLPTWRRWSRVARTRSDDHALMSAAGLSIPRRGPLSTFGLADQVVAYVDVCAHRGEGKIRGTAQELRERGTLAGTYCSAWVGHEAGGRTTRLLGIGRLWWWLTYRQRWPGEWRSNVGDVEVATHDGPDDPRPYMTALARLQRMLREPLVAVDFVQVGSGASEALVAIDLATAPGIAGTPVASHAFGPMDGMLDIVQEIAARWHEVNP